MQLKYYRVSVVESERGWGQKIDSTHFFRDEAEAKEFVKNENKSNTARVVPDWYMYATAPDTIYIDEELAVLIAEDVKKTKRKKK